MQQHEIDQAREQFLRERRLRINGTDLDEVLSVAKPGAEQELVGLCDAMSIRKENGLEPELDPEDEDVPPAWADDEP